MELSDWLPALQPEQDREQMLAETFRAVFGERGVHLWRAPGRVNLIGEHTDYNNLPVLPMAIPFDISILFSPRRDRHVNLANTSPDFELRTFEVEETIPPFEPGDWGNYAKAATQGIVSYLGWDSRTWGGFDAVVDGTIPTAAGLSSSSALVVACALAFVESNEITITPPDLAELLAEAEKYVGTRGGGMDQAVCLLAKEGNALLIHFFPLRTEPVRVPSGAAFVVCHSLVSAPKSREARSAYNLRALQCRLAAGILAHQLQIPRANGEPFPRLGDLISDQPGRSAPDLLRRLEDLSRDISWTPRAVARSLGITPDQLAAHWFEPFTVEMDPDHPMRILECARHVLSESQRVVEACAALRRGDLDALGTLMNASHESCAGDFEISTPELDRLVAVARRHGALGARLTGAGFGGCTVNLVPKTGVEAFSRGVAAEYYHAPRSSPLPGSGDLSSDNAPPIYPCCPAGGASRLF